MVIASTDSHWKTANARKFSLIIDADAYFRALREVLLKARQSIMMIGWDFDFEIQMLPGESDAEGNAPDGFPNMVGPFLDALVDRRPDLDIYLLKWSGGAMIAPGRMTPALRIKFLSPDQIHLALDGAHPIGACHHQKIVVIDDSLAFCGGIDMTDGRWDTPEHLSGNALRLLKNGDVAQPWHDASAVMDGAAARALGELSRARWERAAGEFPDEPILKAKKLWPPSVPVQFHDIDVAIARTEPPGHDRPIITEIEQLWLEAIRAAKRHVYIESQYFAADSITQAIYARLQEPDGPDIVVINPKEAQNHIEDMAMHVTRGRMLRFLRAHDPYDRFRLLYPVSAAGEPIYIHAKLCIIDDRVIRVGSANLDRRSMGFDTECDVQIEAKSQDDRAMVAQIRNQLLAEHLDSDVVEVAYYIEKTDSLIATIKALNRAGARGLRPIRPRKETLLGSLLANTRFFDPRYRRSAQARLGLTSRHIMLGLGTVAIIGLALRRSRRDRS